MKKLLLILMCLFLGSTKTFAQDVPQSERDALVAFYDAMGGDLWTRIDNWKTAQPVSTWYGVTVTTLADGPHVTGLSFDGNGLKGAIPSSIKDLTYLRNLSFGFAKILSIPDEIGNLQMLETFKIDGQSAFGEFALIKSLPENFSNLYNLYDLQLQGQPLDKLPINFGNLKKLKNLDLSQTRLTFLPESIGNLQSLQTLKLSQEYSVNEPLVLPESFGSLLSLQNLTLGGNIYNLPASFKNLINLTDLSLSIKSTEYPTVINDLKKLKTLSLYNSKEVLIKSLPFPNLETLSISGYNTMDSRIFSELVNIKKLSSSIRMDVIDLSSNPNLQTFSLMNSEIKVVNLKNGNNNTFTGYNIINGYPGMNAYLLKCVAVDNPTRAKNHLSPYNQLSVNWESNFVDNFQSDCSSYISSLGTVDIKSSDLKIVNPVKDFLNIQTSQKIDNVEVYATTGQRVKTFKTKEANVSDLAKGVYILKIVTENGISTQKIIKE